MIIEINPGGERPIYEQLRDQIVLGIASGRLSPGEGLPSVRRLAADLGINLHTVSHAYTQLCSEGYIKIDRRRGAAVADAAALEYAGDSPGDAGETAGFRAAFRASLTERLTLAAAEARCRGFGEEEFLEMCRECYGNNKIN